MCVGGKGVGFIVDSGASRSTVKSADMLSKVQRLIPPGKVKVAGGDILLVEFAGTLTLDFGNRRARVLKKCLCSVWRNEPAQY